MVLHLLIYFSRSVPDIVETLLPLLSNSTRTRRQVVAQMVRMGLVDNAKELKKPKYVLRVQTAAFVFRGRCVRMALFAENLFLKGPFVLFWKRKGTRIVLWTEEQEQELEMLFDEYKDSDGTGHPINSISVYLTSCPYTGDTSGFVC